MQLKKKSSLYFFTSLACFTLASSVCFSLPSAPIAQSGRVEVTYPNSHTMVIKPSDDARLHYEDFQIGPGEKVLFMQSATSCASHHITGKNSSQILGSIQSNGKVVLVNRHGIVFGKNSEVETGALLVSTLENVDANDFHISSEGNSSIVNEGVLRSKKGSLTLLAPQVRNEGSLEAASVFLASGEVIKLEGSSLSVSGSLKEGLVEQLGNIQASSVLIKLPMRTKSITKNDKTHELFIEEHGSVILGSTSQTKAQKVAVEGTYISVQGSIDATSTLDRGGTVHLLGKEILLQGAKIDSSGLTGGEVLIGGEFQGKGNTPYASKVSMDTSSEIYADGLENGDGGLVVLWSQDRTLFEGKIFAKSGVKTGSGGLVETSSKGSLEVRSGKVNTWSADGKMGQWLLDPKYVKIVSSGSSTCGENKEHTICGDCTDSGTCNLPVSVFSGLESNLTIQSTCGTVITTSFNVTTKAGNNKKANLTFYLCPGDFGCSMQFPKWSWELVGCVQVYDSNHSSGGGLVQITTDGGSLTFPSDYYSIFSIASLDINTNGGDINIPARVEAYVSNLSLTLNAGSGGVITFGTLTGNVTGGLFQQINIGSAEHVSFSTNIQLYGPFTCTPPIHIPEGSSFNINTTGSSYISGGGDILLSGGVEGPGSLTFNAGSSHSVTVGSVGSSTPVASFSVSSSNAKSLSLSRVSTSSGNISIDTPVTLTGNDTILSSKGGSITLPSSTTFTGSKNSLTIDAGSGDINIPGIPSFNSISILGGNVTVGSGLSASGKITLGHTGTATINGGISAGGDFLDTEHNV
jgi:filamentous hemagglutinin family protein